MFSTYIVLDAPRQVLNAEQFGRLWSTGQIRFKEAEFIQGDYPNESLHLIYERVR